MATTRIASVLSDKSLAFFNELSVTSGLIYGGMIGLDKAVFELGRSTKPIASYFSSLPEFTNLGIPMVQSAILGTVVSGAFAFAVPFLTKCIKNAVELTPFSIEAMDKVYDDPKSRKIGIAAGALTGIAMSWNLAINPFLDEKTQVTPTPAQTQPVVTGELITPPTM